MIDTRSCIITIGMVFHCGMLAGIKNTMIGTMKTLGNGSHVIRGFPASKVVVIKVELNFHGGC